MIARHVLATSLVAGLTLGLGAGPALADKPVDKGNPAVKGTTTLMFTKSVKKKFAKDGILVTAVAPAKKRNAVKFVFPAAQSSPQAITHTGGLQFARADAGLVITNFVFDLENAKVDVTVGESVLEDVLDLTKVQFTKKTVKANVKVATGSAALLNGALQTELFTDGMFLAKANSKF